MIKFFDRFSKDFVIRLLVWRQRKIDEKHFILILSFLIGLLAGLAGFLLKNLIHFIENFLTHNFNADGANYLYLLYPAIGILLTSLFVRYLIKDDISHGVTRILYAISKRNNRIKPHNTYSSVVASAITIGFGGSVGAESPIVYTGAAIGSNLGRFFRLEPRVLLLMIGCGAAGAIAGVFKAPIAGLVFTLEVLMIDLTMTSVLPLLISSVTAATFSYIVNGSSALFQFSQTEPFTLERTPFVLLLGIVCGLISLYFTQTMTWLEGIFRKLPAQKYKFLMGAVMLSGLIFLFPPLFGEGYSTINALLAGTPEKLFEGSLFFEHRDNLLVFFAFLGGTMLFKVFASSATNGGGGAGGIFAPSLFLGCLVGFIFSYAINTTELFNHLPVKNFALMGMAGVMAGVMHAPLTGIFLIAELTGGYNLFLPLMMVCASSYATIKLFQPNNIYAIRLAQKGELITHHKDKAVLTLMEMDSVIEKDFEVISPEMYLGDIVKVISKAKRNIFPVVNDSGLFLGMVLLDDIRNIMFRPELYNRFQANKLMVVSPVNIELGQPMAEVMKAFDQTSAWNLPVVSNGKYIGFVSKSKIFNSYRKVLMEYSHE